MRKGKSGHSGQSSNNDQHQNQNNQRRISGEIGIAGKVKTDFPPEFLKEYRTANESTDTREGKRVILEYLTLGFVILTAIFAFVQVWQSIRSANAARDAADVAKDSLQISERAYLFLDNPSISVTAPGLAMHLMNSGHLAAENLDITIYTMALKASNQQVVDGHWSKWKMRDVPSSISGSPGSYITMDSPKVDGTQIAEGLIAIVGAGTIEYDDGFPKTPRKTAFFCEHSAWNSTSGTIFFIPCDPDAVIMDIKKRIGYPNNYEEPNR